MDTRPTTRLKSPCVRPVVVRGALLAAILFVLPLGAGCLEGDAPVLPRDERGEPLTEGVEGDAGWPALEDATIRPGVLVRALEQDCPSNFVFTRPDNASVFLGVTAYCLRGMRIGDYVTVDPGRTDAVALVVYSSAVTMAERGETDDAMLEYNDFAVVRIEPEFRHLVHPAMLGIGGPTAIADVPSIAEGDMLVTYGEVADGAPESVRQSVVTGRAGDWAILTYGAPTLPGRMGTGVVTPAGEAVGLMVTLGVVPNPGANAVARLDAVMAYAREHANLEMTLATWGMTPSPVLH